MEINGIWTETFKIRTFMADKNLEATLPSIANLLQDTAGNHATFRKLGYFDLIEKNMFWVLNRLKIDMLRFPKWSEDITIKTWVSEMQPFSHRHFVLTDASGQDIGCGFSLWVPIDSVTHRHKRLTSFDIQIVDNHTLCGIPPKLPDTEGVEFSSERKVEYSDIDVLNHVNNVKYVEWILNDYYKIWGPDKYNTLEINYLNECLEDDGVVILAKKESETMFYVLRRLSDNKEVCRALLSF